jgi:hypothetical protein
MASISERENREIEVANASGNTPVVFIHGLSLASAPRIFSAGGTPNRRAERRALVSPSSTPSP